MDLSEDFFMHHEEPLSILGYWIQEARSRPEIRSPLAMSLATVSREGHPSSRIVLAKEVRPEGVVFFTNYRSPKGHDIDHHPRVSATFFWDQMQLQVNLQGRAQKIDPSESRAYWEERPRGSQVSQYLSEQSQPIENRAELEKRFVETQKKFLDQPIPCPSHWGGHLIQVDTIEFWVDGENRLHDRFLYKKGDHGWSVTRIQP